MKIWVDADACPVVIKEILFKASIRTGVEVTLVANQFMQIPKAKTISFLQVTKTFDSADNEIEARAEAGDLIITSDIPLAAAVIEKNGCALSPRGETFTKDNIKSRLNMRDFLDNLRSSGVNTGGPPPLNHSDRQAFANALDKWLRKFSKQQ